MGTVTKQYTFSVGATIVASEHNTNFDDIYNEFNGSIDNDNIKSSANIADTKLAQIQTAGKVRGAAMTRLDTVPALAGALPKDNVTAFVLGTCVTGHIAYFTNGTGWVVLADGWDSLWERFVLGERHAGDECD